MEDCKQILFACSKYIYIKLYFPYTWTMQIPGDIIISWHFVCILMNQTSSWESEAWSDHTSSSHFTFPRNSLHRCHCHKPPQAHPGRFLWSFKSRRRTSVFVLLQIWPQSALWYWLDALVIEACIWGPIDATREEPESVLALQALLLLPKMLVRHGMVMSSWTLLWLVYFSTCTITMTAWQENGFQIRSTIPSCNSPPTSYRDLCIARQIWWPISRSYLACGHRNNQWRTHFCCPSFSSWGQQMVRGWNDIIHQKIEGVVGRMGSKRPKRL